MVFVYALPLYTQLPNTILYNGSFTFNRASGFKSGRVDIDIVLFTKSLNSSAKEFIQNAYKECSPYTSNTSMSRVHVTSNILLDANEVEEIYDLATNDLKERNTTYTSYPPENTLIKYVKLYTTSSTSHIVNVEKNIVVHYTVYPADLNASDDENFTLIDLYSLNDMQKQTQQDSGAAAEGPIITISPSRYSVNYTIFGYHDRIPTKAAHVLNDNDINVFQTINSIDQHMEQWYVLDSPHEGHRFSVSETNKHIATLNITTDRGFSYIFWLVTTGRFARSSMTGTTEANDFVINTLNISKLSHIQLNDILQTFSMYNMPSPQLMYENVIFAATDSILMFIGQIPENVLGNFAYYIDYKEFIVDV